MTTFKEGDWVRYTEKFCATFSTEIGRRNQATLRGKVVLVPDDGIRLLVDWGDQYLEFDQSTKILALVDAAEAASLEERDGWRMRMLRQPKESADAGKGA